MPPGIKEVLYKCYLLLLPPPVWTMATSSLPLMSCEGLGGGNYAPPNSVSPRTLHHVGAL